MYSCLPCASLIGPLARRDETVQIAWLEHAPDGIVSSQHIGIDGASGGNCVAGYDEQNRFGGVSKCQRSGLSCGMWCSKGMSLVRTPVVK